MNCGLRKAGTLAKKMYARNSEQGCSSTGVLLSRVKLLTANLCGIKVFVNLLLAIPKALLI